MAMMTAEQALENAKGITFEQFWASMNRLQERQDRFQEQQEAAWAKQKEAWARQEAAWAQQEKANAEAWAKQKEADAEAWAKQKEADAEAWAKQKEAWAKQEKADAEARARLDKLSENVGGLNRSMGALIETLMTSRLWVKFNKYGHHLVRAYSRVQLFNDKNEELSDIDILLSNTDECMAVEVKREADEGDIDHHLKRMQLIEKYPPAEAKGKKVYSAIAGAVVPPAVRDYAWSKGMYVLEMNGEQVSLLTPPEGFTEKAW